MAQEGKEAKKEADLKAVCEAEGMKGVLTQIGVTPQAAYVEIREILEKAPALPDAAEVFKAFDATKKDGGKGDVGPVLKLMGLKAEALAPGTSPWRLRTEQVNGKPAEKLVISLADGRKVTFVRP